MKSYVIQLDSGYDGSSLVAVFLNKEQAEAYARAFARMEDNQGATAVLVYEMPIGAPAGDEPLRYYLHIHIERP